MSWKMKRAVPVTVVAALGLFLGGCASAPNARPGRNQATVVQVQNLNQNRIVVDAVSGGIDRRLGEVETGATDDFMLPQTVSLLDLQILVDPVGPPGSFMTDRINAGPGDLIELAVQPNLGLTTVSVR
ncbi:MAG: hypothetical protein PVI31_08645 [Gemmatimonadota bacterium]|jgi:hypothetical protein